MSLVSLNSDCLGLILDQLGIKELTQLAPVNRRLHDLIQARSDYRITVNEFSHKTNRYDRFYWLCGNGCLTLSRNYYRDNPVIDTHRYSDAPFLFACFRNQLEVAQWIWSLDGRINLSTLSTDRFPLLIQKWIETLK